MCSGEGIPDTENPDTHTHSHTYTQMQNIQLWEGRHQQYTLYLFFDFWNCDTTLWQLTGKPGKEGEFQDTVLNAQQNLICLTLRNRAMT